MRCLLCCCMDGQVFYAPVPSCWQTRSLIIYAIGSFQEFLPILQLFKEQFSPKDLPYHLIVPSIPGYAFSSTTPLDQDWSTADIARVVDKLMNDLGFGDGYVAQGGDIGSRVGRVLAVDYESCKGQFSPCLLNRAIC